MSTISRCKQSPNFPYQFLKTRGSNELTSLSFTIVHQSEQGQVQRFFRKLKGGESSGKVLSQRAAIKAQPCSCSSIKLDLKRYTWPCRDSYAIICLYIILHTGCLPWQKLSQTHKIVILTHTCRPTVAALLFVFAVNRAASGELLCI